MEAACRNTGAPPASRTDESIARAVVERLIPDAAARRMFGVSLVYLFALFLAMLVDRAAGLL